MSKKIQEYKNEKITVTFDPNTCAHAAACVNHLPGVFNIKARPWINVGGASVEEIKDQIHKCPSGALKYEIAGSGAKVESMGGVEIDMIANGPLVLKGSCVIKDADGNVIKEADKVSLCRCGASSMKPFCDGSHKKVGFEG